MYPALWPGQADASVSQVVVDGPRAGISHGSAQTHWVAAVQPVHGLWAGQEAGQGEPGLDPMAETCNR